MESLRLKVRDAIQEYIEANPYCAEDIVDTTCDLADIIFDQLGITPKEQDIEGATVKVIVNKNKK